MLPAVLLAAVSTTSVWSQCDNTMACNYDPAGTEPCTFNTTSEDLSEGVLVGIPFGQAGLDPDADCPVQPINDNLVQMAPNAEGELQFVIDDAVLAYFEAAVASGSATQEQADQFLGLMTYSTFSFCGETMTADLPGIGVVTSEWNGSYWLITPVNYYIAPVANAPTGCSDVEALNFDVCALSDPAACVYPACEDPLACNYTPGTDGLDDCIYFDTENFTLEENDFIGFYETEDCASGYAGWNDTVLPLGQDSTGGPLYFTLFPVVQDALIANGLQALVDDILTVTMSVCGDTMNYNSIYGDYDFLWDGYGFLNTIYGGYIAPESAFVIGCPDPTACNYDPCSHPFVTDACEYLVAGTLEGVDQIEQGTTATFTYSAADGNTVEWYSACGSVEADGPTATLTAEVLGECEICATESTPDGCVGESVCFGVTVVVNQSVAEATPAFTFSPNPATDQLQLRWEGQPTNWVVRDAAGRIVLEQWVSQSAAVIDLSGIDPGMYLIGPANGATKPLTVVR